MFNQTVLFKLKVLQKTLLDNPTVAEHNLHKYLVQHKIKHKRQQIIAPYIVDFYLPDVGLVIELDGNIHNKTRNQISDYRREQYLFTLGIIVVRYKNRDSLDKILSDIQEFYSTPMPQSRQNMIKKALHETNFRYGYSNGKGDILKLSNPPHRGVVKKAFRELRGK